MSEEEKSTGDAAAATMANDEPTEQPVNDEHTTEPNTQDPPPPAPVNAGAKWEMPKPVFQKTSGYLPQGYVTDTQQEAARANPDNENTTQEQPVFVPELAAGPDLSAVNLSPAVEPQPDLSEQLIPDEPALGTAPPPKRNGAVGTSMIVVGLIAIMIFVAVFLGVIYFLFLRNPTDPSPF